MNSLNLTRRGLLGVATGIAITGLDIVSIARSKEKKPDALGKELIFRTTDPRNGEPSLSQLVQSWITPVKHFYVRSHAPNPVINADNYVLTVEGRVRTPLKLSLAQLRQLTCLLYTSPSPRDATLSRMPSSA